MILLILLYNYLSLYFMNNFRRHGDVNLHPISPKLAEKVRKLGKVVDSDGSFIMARGEATNSTHDLTVKEPSQLIVREFEGKTYYELLAPAIATHTHDHEPITVEPDFYVFIPEREVDHFANSITRKVID